jgi:hypothetical protein
MKKRDEEVGIEENVSVLYPWNGLTSFLDWTRLIQQKGKSQTAGGGQTRKGRTCDTRMPKRSTLQAQSK